MPIGARFSNRVLQALMVLLQKPPPHGRRLLVLATTSNHRVLQEMEIVDCFQADIHVPAISTFSGLLRVVESLDLFTGLQDYERFQNLLRAAGWSEEDRFVIGVKKLVSLIEMSRQDTDPADRLLKGLLTHAGSQASL